MGKRVNKRIIVATMYKNDGAHRLTQELITYTHRTQVPDLLKDIQDRVNRTYKFQEQHLFFLDEKEN